MPVPIASDTTLARLNIRANLKAIKTALVNQVYNMLVNSPSKVDGKPPLTDAQKIDMANEIADVYIRTTDLFLDSHYGASPSPGKRIGLFDQLGNSNAFNSPWCADWAQGMLAAMGNDLSLTTQAYISMKGARWNKAQDPNPPNVIYNQHNWMALYPRGYDVPITIGEDLNPLPVLFLDPWLDLMPKAYLPANHTLLTTWDLD